MSNCIHCGADIPPGAVACESCGAAGTGPQAAGPQVASETPGAVTGATPEASAVARATAGVAPGAVSGATPEAGVAGATAGVAPAAATGAVLGAAPELAPGAQPGYPPHGAQQQMSAPQMAPAPAQRAPAGPPPVPQPAFIAWAVVAIIQCVCCGGVAYILPVVGVVLAFWAKSDWDQGSYGASLSKFKIAKLLTIIGFVMCALAVVTITIVALLPVLMTGALMTMGPAGSY